MNTVGAKILGLALIAVAVALALDPDYPITRDGSHSSAESDGELGSGTPRPVHPIGASSEQSIEFRWEGEGRWHLVLLDEHLEVLFRTPPIDGARHLAGPEMSLILQRGRRFHWLVESADRPELRSAPVPLLRR